MKLSDKIRIIRKARGLSQEALGDSLSRVSENGISRQSVSDWENGGERKCSAAEQQFAPKNTVFGNEFATLRYDFDLLGIGKITGELKAFEIKFEENL